MRPPKVSTTQTISIQVTYEISDFHYTMKLVQGVPIVEIGPSTLLSICQRFFSTELQEFQAAAVYVVIREMSREYIIHDGMEEELRPVIGCRLNHNGVSESEEGSFIRIALALQARVWMKIQGGQVFEINSAEIPEREVVLEKFQSLFSVLSRPTGEYRMEITVTGFSQPISKTGTLLNLQTCSAFQHRC